MALIRSPSLGFAEPHSEFYLSFTKALTAAIQKWPPPQILAAHDDPLMFLLPVLDIHTTILGANLSQGVQSIRGLSLPQQIDQAWYSLRRIRHDGAQRFDCFIQYDSTHNAGRTQEKEMFMRLYDRHRRVMEQVERTELFARECHQVSTASLSIEESRTSIKQARRALQESRRTKLSQSET